MKLFATVNKELMNINDWFGLYKISFLSLCLSVYLYLSVPLCLCLSVSFCLFLSVSLSQSGNMPSE